jgi:DNA topoisomerase II
MKIKQRKVKPTPEQLVKYTSGIGITTIRTTNLRFGKFVILGDEDLDGYHLSSLILSFFAKYWPELFDLGMMYRMQTPLYLVTTSKGEKLEFFTDDEFEAWAKNAPKHKADRYKGLGGFSTEDFETFLKDRQKYLIKIDKLSKGDFKKFELAFSNTEQDSRKVWLQDVEYFTQLN